MFRDEVAAAARAVRAAFAVVNYDGNAAYGHAHNAVEALVMAQTHTQQLSGWRTLGQMLHSADPEISEDRVAELYASCQYGRHVKVTWAAKHLPAGGPLNPLACCVLAARILRAYVQATGSGDLVAPSG